MQTKPGNIDVILPYGETLRTFMEQSFIRPADLKATLRGRGVFVSSSEKTETIPLLISTLLSPGEFDQLRERQCTREDNPKTNTRFIHWNSDKPLLECIPDALNVADLVKDAGVNYSIIGTPTFVPVGKGNDHVRMEVEIERRDLSKSWCLSDTKFKASVELQRIFDGKTVKLLLTHTAQETKDLTQKITKHLTTHFRTSRWMPERGGIVHMLFDHFTNEQRVKFFWSLTADIHQDWFEFQQINDFGICPAPGEELPPELKWMSKNIKELTFRGSELQENLFLKNSEYHSKLLFFRMEARYKFGYYAAHGECSIVFEFTNFDSENTSECEFETNVSQLSLAPKFNHVNRVHVKEQLLRQLETFIQTQYDQIVGRDRVETDAATPEPAGQVS